MDVILPKEERKSEDWSILSRKGGTKVEKGEKGAGIATSSIRSRESKKEKGQMVHRSKKGGHLETRRR